MRVYVSIAYQPAEQRTDELQPQRLIYRFKSDDFNFKVEKFLCGKFDWYEMSKLGVRRASNKLEEKQKLVNYILNKVKAEIFPLVLEDPNHKHELLEEYEVVL